MATGDGRAAVKYINYIRAAAINGFRAGEKYDPKREVTSTANTP